VLTRSQGAHISLTLLGGDSMFQVMSWLFKGTVTARVITATTKIPKADVAISQNSPGADSDLTIQSHVSAANSAVRTSGGMNLAKCTCSTC
jgi:hypothetical protein